MLYRFPGSAWSRFPAILAMLVLAPLAAIPALTATGSGAQAAPASAADPACAHVLLVGLEGPKSRKSKGAKFAPVLQPVAATFRAQSAASGRTVEIRRLKTKGASAAVLVGGASSKKAKLAVTGATLQSWVGDAVDVGRARLTQTLAQAASACPDQQIVLTGHAQGAVAIHRSLSDLAATYGARLMGVVLVSDADRTRRSNANVTGAPAAPNKSRGAVTKVLKNTVDAPATTSGTPVESVCTRGDVVCDLRGNKARSAVAIHGSYAGGSGAAAVSAAAGRTWSRVARWARASLTEATVPVGVPFEQQLRIDVDPAVVSSVRWSEVTGLPAGVTLSPTGVLAGQVDQEGSWNIGYAVRAGSSPLSYGTFVLTSALLEPQVSMGGQSTCEVRQDTTAWCYGNNAYGQVGDGTTKDRTNPQQVGDPGWAQISTSGAVSCGVRLDQTLWCWGMNNRGQLGLGHKAPRVTNPTQVAAHLRWSSVTAGWLDTCAIGADGSLWCWGDNSRGQLGIGDTRDRLTPARVGSATTWSSVTLGGYYACGTQSDGSGWCWGQNSFGQLGTGDTGTRRSPSPVTGAAGWATLDAGWAHTCGRTIAGRAHCWGLNDQGQLGSSGKNTSTPREVSGGRTWLSVTSGDSFACGVTAEHNAVCWGSNRYGQLGDGQSSLKVSARQVGGAWADLDAGWFSVCARPLAGGDTVCWGNNERGQLGTGDRRNRSTAYGRTSAAPFPTRAAKNPDEFVTTTFNILGSQHTEPGGGAPLWGPGRLRTEWAANMIQSSRSSLLAFQEIQTDQVRTLEKIVGNRYDSWPGVKAGVRAAWQTVMWDKKTWTLEEKENVDLPVLGRTRPHPLVLLRNNATGKKVWLFNIHNSSKQTPERKKERRKAMKIIVKEIKAKRAQKTPVILLGDFNDRRTAFCTVTGKTDLKATLGGSNKKGKCRTPKHMGIDWIFASKDLKTLNYSRSRTSMVLRISDHPVVSSTLRFK